MIKIFQLFYYSGSSDDPVLGCADEQERIGESSVDEVSGTHRCGARHFQHVLQNGQVLHQRRRLEGRDQTKRDVRLRKSHFQRAVCVLIFCYGETFIYWLFDMRVICPNLFPARCHFGCVTSFGRLHQATVVNEQRLSYGHQQMCPSKVK